MGYLNIQTTSGEIVSFVSGEEVEPASNLYADPRFDVVERRDDAGEIIEDRLVPRALTTPRAALPVPAVSSAVQSYRPEPNGHTCKFCMEPLSGKDRYCHWHCGNGFQL